VRSRVITGRAFHALKNNATKKYGEHRTRRLVLAAWDRLALAPRDGDGRYDAGATETQYTASALEAFRALL
jgi:hypothetical protein